MEQCLTIAAVDNIKHGGILTVRIVVDGLLVMVDGFSKVVLHKVALCQDVVCHSLSVVVIALNSIGTHRLSLDSQAFVLLLPCKILSQTLPRIVIDGPLGMLPTELHDSRCLSLHRIILACKVIVLNVEIGSKARIVPIDGGIGITSRFLFRHRTIASSKKHCKNG